MITNPDRKILVLWVIAIALITNSELRSGQGMPRPHRYVGSAIVYGIAAVLAEVSGDLAFWMALGWTLAIAYGQITSAPKGAIPSSKTTAAKSAGKGTK